MRITIWRALCDSSQSLRIAVYTLDLLINELMAAVLVGLVVWTHSSVSKRQWKVVIKMAEGTTINHKGLMRVRSPIIQTFAYSIQISHMQTSNDTDM